MLTSVRRTLGERQGSRSAKVYEGFAGKPRFCSPQPLTRRKRSRLTNGLTATSPRTRGSMADRVADDGAGWLCGATAKQGKRQKSYVRPVDDLSPKSTPKQADRLQRRPPIWFAKRACVSQLTNAEPPIARLGPSLTPAATRTARDRRARPLPPRSASPSRRR
jgi:hypothetical protein